ncbi:unnamed protein product [Kuraishia capsulata CBS 1993]|uniref:Rad60/SUMO-like domain-containing protein n=1 Tax=Kuraishia capsulata CBS 1993 TaxID=1382522 RepID=W6MHQ7_9ASCO|nr:uncharacterized protein KUCA_T00001496001 [Kuraishia capsulata CBS 1993]CDK25526.1 unnamed protein product [Kuraishia capsulata CBS 1993]
MSETNLGALPSLGSEKDGPKSDIFNDFFSLASTVDPRPKKKKKKSKKKEKESKSDVGPSLDISFSDLRSSPKVFTEPITRGRKRENESDDEYRELTPPPKLKRVPDRRKERGSISVTDEQEDAFLQSLQKSTQSFNVVDVDEVEAYIPQSYEFQTMNEDDLAELKNSKFLITVQSYFNNSGDELTMRTKADHKFSKIKRKLVSHFQYPLHRADDFVFYEPNLGLTFADELPVYSVTKSMKRLRTSVDGDYVLLLQLQDRKEAQRLSEKRMQERLVRRAERDQDNENDSDLEVIDEGNSTFIDEVEGVHIVSSAETQDDAVERYFSIEVRGSSTDSVKIEVSNSTEISKIAEYYKEKKGLNPRTKLSLIMEDELDLNSTVGDAELEDDDILDVKIL